MPHKKCGPDRFSRFDVYTHDVHKENMFTINLEDGREAPSKARKKGAKRLEFLVHEYCGKRTIVKEISIIENRTKA